MNKIIVLIGVSGSGKSTFAKGYVENHRDTVIISRDTIRMALFGFSERNYRDYYKGDVTEREKIVTNFFNSQVSYALEKGLDVIADNTHLNTSYIYAYKQFGVPLEIRIFDTSEDGCILRDLSRVKCVGADVIKKQYKSFQKLKNSNFREEVLKYNEELLNIYATCKKAEYDEYKPCAVICDVDGTAALMNNRGPFEWDKVHTDKRNPVVFDIVSSLQKQGKTIIFLSGRDGICYDTTKQWLEQNGYRVDYLFMRKANDSRPDDIVKKEIFINDISNNFSIDYVIDDRPKVIRMWKRIGLETVIIGNPWVDF